MEAKELRIGNWVIDEEGDPIQIEAGQIAEAAWGYIFTPIIITEEWLLKLGLVHDELNGYKINIGNNALIIDDEERAMWVDGEKYGSIIARGVKNVHQLQNLYFALTREELTLNSVVTKIR